MNKMRFNHNILYNLSSTNIFIGHIVLKDITELLMGVRQKFSEKMKQDIHAPAQKCLDAVACYSSYRQFQNLSPKQTLVINWILFCFLR